MKCGSMEILLFHFRQAYNKHINKWCAREVQNNRTHVRHPNALQLSGPYGFRALLRIDQEAGELFSVARSVRPCFSRSGRRRSTAKSSEAKATTPMFAAKHSGGHREAWATGVCNTAGVLARPRINNPRMKTSRGRSHTVEFAYSTAG